jgi:hypothetical protein
MEDYVTYNTNYESDPFDQYSDTTPSTDDTVEPVNPSTDDDDNNTEIDSGDAEVVTTAGLQDILKPISSSDKKEDVEEVKIESVEESTEDNSIEEAEEEDPEDDGEFGSEDEEESADKK